VKGINAKAQGVNQGAENQNQKQRFCRRGAEMMLLHKERFFTGDCGWI
jgi:ribosomal protein S27AE